MRVRADEGRRYVYPDVTVVCGTPRYEGRREDVLANPTVVVEILSDSTETKDRGWKMEAYQRLESVREVVLLSQDSPVAEVFRRGADGGWDALLPVRGMDAGLRLESIGFDLPLSELYEGLPPVARPPLTRSAPRRV